MKRRRPGPKPKNGIEAATERIQVRVTPDVKKTLQENNVDLAVIVDGIAKGLPRKNSLQECLPKAS